MKDVPNLSITTLRTDGPWKEGPELIDRADGVVLFLAEGAKWISDDPKRLAALRRLAKRGGGLTTLHWAMGAREAGPINAFVDLFGGCHGGPDRKYKVLQTDAKVADGKHPITRGLADVNVKDEFYYQLKFPKAQAGTAPLIRVKIDGEDHTVAWAYDRPGGGRGFGFSGLHFHDNWKLPAYRRLVAQGVLWSLGLPIPEAGLKIDPEDTVFRPLHEKTTVVIRTDKGDVEVELDAKRAPITVDNFLRYVDAGLYTDSVFHRTVRADNQPEDKVKIAVIQAGVNPKRAKEKFAPIKIERTKKTGLKHVDGAISMARDGPDTATGDFFLCVGNQPEMDQGGKRNPDKQGFAAFGKVVKGMDVVKTIHAAPAKEQTLTPPVRHSRRPSQERRFVTHPRTARSHHRIEFVSVVEVGIVQIGVETKVDVTELLKQFAQLSLRLRPAVVLHADRQVVLLIEIDDVAGKAATCRRHVRVDQLHAHAFSIRKARVADAHPGFSQLALHLPSLGKLLDGAPTPMSVIG